MQTGWAKKHKLQRIGLLLTAVLLQSACDPSGGSATVKRIGDELNEVLPTVSVEDTEQTKSENATFREVFFSIWPRFRPE